MESWKSIPGYEGIYEISDLGNIRSIKLYRTDKNGKTYRLPAKILKPLLGTDNYHFVCLYKGGEAKQLRVHRLVLTAFVGSPPEGYYANHLDGNRINNKLCNLKWASPAENNLHAYSVLGRAPVSLPGEKNGFAKLTPNDIKLARQMREQKHTFQSIANKFGISKSHAKRIVDGLAWSHI